jgi:predicted 3-demethylubiquinone-9 3-methyltransferase (glyoxalase superfamily)
MPHPIVPNLWFDTEAEEAAAFYTSVFPNSRIVNVTRYTEAGPREAGMVMTVEWELDRYWERLSEDGEEGPCGWLKDRYGLSWQVVPTGMDEVFADPDPERARRAMEAMLGMRKLDIAALRRAADGVPAS